MDQNQLTPGLRFNDALQRHSQLRLVLFLALAATQCPLLLIVKDTLVSILALLSLLLCSGMALVFWVQGRQWRSVTVLADGLEVDRRVISYADIVNVECKDGMWILLHYTFHGVEMKERLGVDANSDLNLHQLCRELAQKAGISVATKQVTQSLEPVSLAER